MLTDGAQDFLTKNALTLGAIANLWWAQCLERVNVLCPLIIDKVVRDRAQRASLANLFAILRHSDGPHCFYCERRIDSGASPCAACDISKRDTLPHRDFTDKLAATHVDRLKRMPATQMVSPTIERVDVNQYYDAARSVEWPSGWRRAKNNGISAVCNGNMPALVNAPLEASAGNSARRTASAAPFGMAVA